MSELTTNYTELINQKAAELVDLIERGHLRHDAKDKETAEYNSLVELAISNIKLGRLFAVRAATI